MTVKVPRCPPQLWSAVGLLGLLYGLRRRDEKHRAIARWTYPLWIYVSCTGVIIYLMLYQLY